MEHYELPMRKTRAQSAINVLASVLLISAGSAKDAHAYIDPGITGMFSQLLYLLFYGALGVLVICIGYLKHLQGRVATHLSKWFKFNKSQPDGQETGPNPPGDCRR